MPIPGHQIELDESLAPRASRVPAAADPSDGLLSESLDARVSPGVTTATYLQMHAARLVHAVGERVAVMEPELPPGVRWLDYPQFARLFMGELRARLGGDLAQAAQLRDLVHPADPYAAIDGARGGLRDWSDAAGRAFAFVVEGAVRDSVTRMAARSLEPAQPAASQPMDRLVAAALFARGVLAIDTPRPAKERRKLDARKLVWQRATDPAMSDWVQPAEPEATAEEVAGALGGDPSHAYRITATPPFFGLARRWARKLPGAARVAPPDEAAPDDLPDGLLAATMRKP